MQSKFWSGLLTCLLNDEKILALMSKLLGHLSKKTKSTSDESMFGDMLKKIEDLRKK